MRILMFHPLVLPVLALMAGIGWAEGMDALWAPWLWPPVMLALWLLCCFLFRVKRRQMGGGCLLLLMLLVGCWRMELKEQAVDGLQVGARQACGAVVFSVPIVRERSVSANLLLTDGPNARQLVRALFIGDSLARHLSEGDGIRLSASSTVVPFSDLRSKDIHLATFLRPGQWTPAVLSLSSLRPMDRLRYRLLCWRRQLLDRLRSSGLHDEAYRLGAAMVLGVRQQVSKEVRQQYADAGVSHLLALSGMHLSVVYVLVALLFGRFRRYLVVEMAVVALLWFYALLTGLSPSVLRAVILVSVTAIIRLAGRRPISLNTLAFVAMVQLLWQPLSLFDVSFQLSYLAVASILILYPMVHRPLASRFECLRTSDMGASRQRLHHRLLRMLVSMVLVSVVAQIGVAPISIHYFGSFPLLFVIGNLVMVPLAVVLLYTMLLLLFLSMVASGSFLLSLTVTFLHFLLSLQSAFLSVVAPLGTVHHLHLNTIQTWLCYLLLAVLVVFFYRFIPPKRAF